MPGQNEQAIFKVDTTIYSKACLFRACYKFTDRAYVFLSRPDDDPNSIVVSITSKQIGCDPRQIIREFSNELIDQGTREILEEEFGPIRNLIVAQAFSEGNLLERISPAKIDDEPRGID
jgi:His-Xaa-Ser system protein HxsD